MKRVAEIERAIETLRRGQSFEPWAIYTCISIRHALEWVLGRNDEVVRRFDTLLNGINHEIAGDKEQIHGEKESKNEAEVETTPRAVPE